MATGHLVSVVGARPQFIKVAPVCRALQRVAYPHEIIHTGQHYDREMSAVFFEELKIPRPSVDLNIGSGKHGEQTAAMLAALEKQFEDKRPDAVIVYGDTNSTLAAALAAAKLHIPLAHIEAGLRSCNREMPEEINRIVSDHCSDMLFAPTAEAMRNLHNEGLGQRSTLVGDVMYDAVLHNREIAARRSTVLSDLELAPEEYGTVTIHRPANTEINNLKSLMQTLAEIADSVLPIIFPIHPRTRAILGDEFVGGSPRLRIVEPQSYLDMLALVEKAKFVLTDSGGLQKDAAFLGTPCVTLRDETEWTETVEMGANTLVGADRRRILAAVNDIVDTSERNWTTQLAHHYGDGEAAGRIAAEIISWLSQESESVG